MMARLIFIQTNLASELSGTQSSEMKTRPTP